MQFHHNPTPYFPENLRDYAPWVAEHGLVAPYGECQCGCGQSAPLAKKTKTRVGHKQGAPVRYIVGHAVQGRSKRGKYRDLVDAFWSRIDEHDPERCWPWRGAMTPGGYGNLSFKAKQYAAHRVSYELHYGPVPDKLFVCHTCDNPACVNPRHLWLGTAADNAVDRNQKGRQVRGERQASSVLTENDVVVMRELRQHGVMLRDLARQFGISESHVWKIVKGRSWRHAPFPALCSECNHGKSDTLVEELPGGAYASPLEPDEEE